MKLFFEKWRIFYLFIAFLFVVCIGCNQIETVTGKDEKKAAYPPAVMWNNRVYWIESEPSFTIKENIGEKLGEVTSFLDYGVPTKNGESNCFGVGCIIYAYQGNDRKIIVEWVDQLTLNTTLYSANG